MDHGPNQSDDEQPEVSSRNARIGLWLFAVYLVFYVVFMLVSAFSPESMAARPLSGVNLAIWYGFALLLGALVMALVYSWLCRARDAA